MNGPLGHGDYTSRLEAIRPALEKFIRSLSDRDRAMLITFSERHEVLQKLARMRRHVIEGLVREVKGITAYRNTRFAEAIEAALKPLPQRGKPSRLILFTDGNSTVNPAEDHVQMVYFAEKANKLGIPLFIYGTGSDYNWEFLQQLAVRAGNGSFCKHVMDASTLDAHLSGELAFQRGVAVEGLTIDGQSALGQIVRVTRFMPTQMDLPDLGQLGSDDPRPRDFFDRGRFHDGTGSLDYFRGQQLLIELDVPFLPVGQHNIMTFTMKGAVIPRGLLRFTESLETTITITNDSAQLSPVDAEVMRIMRLMAARKAAEKERFQQAEVLYRRAGDGDTADTMHTLHQMSLAGEHNRVDLRRESATVSSIAASRTMTDLDGAGESRGRRRPSRRVDSDSTPTDP
jgi:hypothetical protein